jgi:glyoxylase-like metal-dependent hydrolase (beta-lactamase superfamily II)
MSNLGQNLARRYPDDNDPRLRLFRRRPASRAWLGQVRSQQSEESPPPLFGAGGAGEAHATTRIVIDTSPDLREQLIDANVDHIDAVFLTHEHADQTHGIDDLRSVVMHQRKRIALYLNQSTA